MSTNSSMASSMAYAAYLNNVSSQFSAYFVLASSFVGIPFNMLSILLFWRLRRHKTNMGFLCACQAAVDTFVLVSMFALIRPPYAFINYRLVTLSDSACKFFTFLRRFVLHISSWMPVLITFDRLTFVLYTHANKFKLMKSKLFLSGVILVMFAAIAIADTPNLLYYLSTPPNGGPSSCTGTLDIILSSDMISIVLRTYAPLILMVVFNLAMRRKIFDKKRMTFKQSGLNRREYQFTLAVVAFDVYFFLTNFPLSIFYIFYDINLYSGALNSRNSSDPVFVATYNLINNVFINLSFVEQTLAFFMNLAFNKLFRREFFYVLGVIFRIKKFSQVGPSGHTQTAIQTTN